MSGPAASVACCSELPSLVRHVELHVHKLFCTKPELRPLLDACGLGELTPETREGHRGWTGFEDGRLMGTYQAVTKVA